MGRPGFDPCVGKIPWRGKGCPLQYSGLENSMDCADHGPSCCRVGHDWVTFTYTWVSEWVSEVAQWCPTLCNPADCSPQGSSLHGILQAWILEWVAISFSRGSSWLRDRTQVSYIIGRRFNLWATREALTYTYLHIIPTPHSYVASPIIKILTPFIHLLTYSHPNYFKVHSVLYILLV